MSAIERFMLGATARLSAAIIAPDTGLPVDPTGVLLKIRKPDATLVTFIYGINQEIIKTITGNYYMDVVCDQAGKWTWRWEAITPNAGASEGELLVMASHVL